MVYHVDIESIPFVLAVGPFVYWIIFYYIGVCMSKSSRDYSILVPIILIIVGFVSQMIETHYLMQLGKGGTGLKITSWIYSAGAIFLLFSLKIQKCLSSNNSLYRGIVKIGEISFGVYLAHMYFFLINAKFFKIDNWLLLWCFVTILSIAIMLFLKKVVPSKYLKILGIN